MVTFLPTAQTSWDTHRVCEEQAGTQSLPKPPRQTDVQQQNWDSTKSAEAATPIAAQPPIWTARGEQETGPKPTPPGASGAKVYGRRRRSALQRAGEAEAA